jgi:hypothetical protein
MGRRSENLFKRNDVMRAIKSARDAGLPVAGVEIKCKDGTVIKVLGNAENGVLIEDAAAAKQWEDATKAIATRTKKVPRSAPSASSSPRCSTR